ncbi:Cell wall surface anchor family protein [Rhodotorula toruloides ATCC 204091]|uniref:Cell wall surface anchor family protein n=1 Tax=Rhodotorula toruloides TaxID=5286 RepID=A0A0K3CBI6_RHOTO|nr:Cell wall surface anchor family protein [Rhodotorula toruloides ATCC 204091]PRQ75316.1 cell wall surface anchor family protein [Rhodotorula toruloides]
MLDKLPNELLLLIIRLALPSCDTLSPKAAGRRQALLMSLLRVNKRLCDLFRPLLLQSILVGTPRQANLISKLSQTLREQVETVVFNISTTPLEDIDPYDEEDVPDLLVGSEALDALVALPKVKHARFYDFGDFSTEHMTWQTHLDFDLSAKSPFRDLETLYFSDCAFLFLNCKEPASFRLTRLAFVGQIDVKSDGVEALLTPEALPHLDTLRLTRFGSHISRGWRWPWLPVADFRKLLKLISQTSLVQADASCEPEYLPSTMADNCRLLYHLGYSSARTRPSGRAQPSRQFIRLDAESRDSAPYLLDRIPRLHDLRAAFVDRAIHPDTIKPEQRDMALALLDAVKQTPAEIIWTGSDDHAFLLPEFERYIKERQ